MKKVMIYACLLFVICSIPFITSCKQEDDRRDYYYEGMDVYYNYSDYILEDWLPNNLLRDDSFLETYPYQDASFVFYGKNVGYQYLYFGDYCESILTLTYDASTYEQAKRYLFENEHYAEVAPSNSYKNYDFYEVKIKNWSGKRNILYHVFNDSTKTIVLLNQTGTHISDPLYTYAEQGKFIDFFKKYYGDYYDFDAQHTDENTEEIKSFNLLTYEWEISNFSSDQNVGEVNDKKVAIEKAKSLWLEKYDKSVDEMSIEVEYDSKEDCWHVYNKPPKNTLGGIYHAIIDKSGDVIAIWAED